MCALYVLIDIILIAFFCSLIIPGVFLGIIGYGPMGPYH